MNLLCPKCQPCELVNLPYTNLTSEEPDSVRYFSYNYGWGGGTNNPPLGSTWIKQGCKTLCESTISQDDADACAASQNLECVNNQEPEPVQPGGGGGRRVTNAPPVYFNTPQTSYARCPDGTIYYYTIARGRFAAYSQAQANNIAKYYADQEVALHRICFSSLTGSCRPDNTVQLFIIASGLYVDAGLLGSGANLWQITSGSLPDGLTLKGYPNGGPILVAAFAGDTLVIEGTPISAGSFTFTLAITLTNGDYAYKTYQIEVLSDISLGASATVALPNPTCATGLAASATTGSLPSGMLINTVGSVNDLAGTPDTAGLCVFTLTYS